MQSLHDGIIDAARKRASAEKATSRNQFSRFGALARCAHAIEEEARAAAVADVDHRVRLVAGTPRSCC